MIFGLMLIENSFISLAQESPESLLRSALLQGKSSYAKTVNLQNPPQKLTKDEDMLRRALFTEDQVRDLTVFISLASPLNWIRAAK